MFCHQCGKKIPNGSKFCHYCGTQQNASTADPGRPIQSTPPIRRELASPDDEKNFRAYVTPCASRNIFFVMCALTVGCLLAAPIIAGVYAIMTACCSIPWLISRFRLNSRLSHARENGTYDQMLREFAASRQAVNGKIRYSQNYIFGKSRGRFLKYDEIAWIYRHSVSYMLIPIVSQAMVGNSDGKLFSLCRLKLSASKGGEEIKELANLIYQKNPNALLGYSEEIRKEFKKRTR